MHAVCTACVAKHNSLAGQWLRYRLLRTNFCRNKKCFCSLKHPYRLCGPPSLFTEQAIGALTSVEKRPGHEADFHLVLSLGMNASVSVLPPNLGRIESGHGAAYQLVSCLVMSGTVPVLPPYLGGIASGHEAAYQLVSCLGMSGTVPVLPPYLGRIASCAWSGLSPGFKFRN